jgi:hypothetical protein
MQIIKHIPCNNRVNWDKIIKLNPIYSITIYKENSTITIKIQQSIQLIWQYN